MAIKDIFKKKEAEKKVQEKEKPVLKDKEKKGKKTAHPVEVYRVLKSPHITEKSGDLSQKNQYLFKVFKEANKIEIKRAVEKTYNVDVVSVKIINVSGKKRRLGKIKGESPGYKKAIVKIKSGQKIEALLV